MATNRLRRMRRRKRKLPRPRVFHDRQNPLENMANEDIFTKFRFRAETILFIVSLFKDTLISKTARNLPLPPLLQVLATLRFLATGGFHELVGESLRISKSATGRSIRTMCSLLAGHASYFIKFPSNINSTKTSFFEFAGFPNIVGCVDGTFVKILAPTENEGDYVNRKGYHALNIQMVCDAEFRITNIVARWPGSVHDSRIFRESALCDLFERGQIDGILLGDSAYPLNPYLLTPFLHPSSAGEEKYNKAHARTRVLIEQTFGILKRRFSCLHTELRTSPERACTIVTACAVLHNIGILKGDIISHGDVNIDPPPRFYPHIILVKMERVLEITLLEIISARYMYLVLFHILIVQDYFTLHS